MRIIHTLSTNCGASATCDKVHDTDHPDVLVQGRKVDPDLALRHGVPDHEGLLAVKRSVLEIGNVSLMDAGALDVYLDTHHRADLFRVETLDHYAVDSDASEFAQYLRGEPGPDLAGKAGWLDRLRTDSEAGRTWRYVHVLREPLTDYLRYELDWCYRPNTDAGMQIRILDLTTTELPAALLHMGDFFVVDGTTVIRMHYDDSHDFAGAEIVNQNPAVYVATAALLWAAAEPFTTWVTRHPDRHRASSAG